MKNIQGMDGGYIKGLPAGYVLERREFVRAADCFLFDCMGRQYLDMAAGITVPFGHCNPQVRDAVVAASQEIDACEDYSTPYRRELIAALECLLPEVYGGAQFFSSGTEAVEASLRFARRITGRDGILSCFGAYHGKTRGAVSVGNAVTYNGLRVPGHVKIPFPSTQAEFQGNRQHYTAAVRQIINETVGENLGAVIIEPVQGFAGIVLPDAGCLSALCELAKERGAIVILDEIFSGLGRSGGLFAYQRLGVPPPDVLLIGKGLGNGYPITAVVVTEENLKQVSDVEGGTSFGGNPISCAAAVQTLRLFETLNWQSTVLKIERGFLAMAEAIKDNPLVRTVSVYGAMAAVHFRDVGSADPAESVAIRVYRACLRSGLLVTPGTSYIRFTPPLVMGESHLAAAIAIFQEVLLQCLA